MIPAPFEHVFASTVAEATAILREEPEAKLIAGGQSLLPLMKLRFAQPTLLVDLSRVGGLSYVRGNPDHLAIGALTTHHRVATDPLMREHCAILADAAVTIGDPQVRHMGTIGGAVAHADPAGDIPVVLLALQAELVISTSTGAERAVPADDFFQGFFQTALAPDEALVEIRVPNQDAGSAYIRFTHRAQSWPTVAVAVAATGGGSARIALANMGDRPLRAAASESALAEGASIQAASLLADRDTDPPSDEKASGGFRRELAKILTRRALERALG